MKDYREMANDAMIEIKARKRIKNKRKKTIAYVSVCFCLICVLPLSLWMGGMFDGDDKIDILPPETGIESNIHIDPETENSPPIIEEPDVIWADNTEYVYGGGESSLGRTAGIYDYYKDYDDDTLLGWVVYRNATYLYFTEPELRAMEGYQNKYIQEKQKIKERMMAETGMSANEADARIFDDAEYQKIVKEYNEGIFNEVYTKIMDRVYADNVDYIESLKENGIKVEYDASQKEYQGYLYNFCGFCVISASRSQIKEYLAASGNQLSFFPAVSSTENCTDFYVAKEIDLPKGEKITEGAMELFNNAGGESVDVRIYIAYPGGKVYTLEELEAETLRQMGLTYDQLMNSNDSDLIQRFIELKRYIDSDSAYVDALRERVLKEDEYVYDLPWSKIYYAKITYERALEIIESDEIAYIDVVYTEGIYEKDPIRKNVYAFQYKDIVE